MVVQGEYAHYFAVSRTVKESRFAPNADPTTSVEESFDRSTPTGHYSLAVDHVGLGVRLVF
jgi:hypothetical protein